jgi:hypothetical protein
MDLNGPNNVGQWVSDGVATPMQGEPDWDPKIAFLAPVPVGHVISLSKKLNVTVEQTMHGYVERAAQLQKSLKLPVDWEMAKVILLKAINAN